MLSPHKFELYPLWFYRTDHSSLLEIPQCLASPRTSPENYAIENLALLYFSAWRKKTFFLLLAHSIAHSLISDYTLVRARLLGKTVKKCQKCLERFSHCRWLVGIQYSSTSPILLSFPSHSLQYRLHRIPVCCRAVVEHLFSMQFVFKLTNSRVR